MRRGVLVIGMGSWAFGKERRAVSALTQMRRIRPYFLISKWEDGSVSRLLRRHNFAFGVAPFGYLGRAKPRWTLVTLWHMPALFRSVMGAVREHQCGAILVVTLQAFANALAPVMLLRYCRKARVILYLGDIPPADRLHCVLGSLVNRVGDRVIANSGAVKSGLVGIGIRDDKIRVIHNGVDVDRYATAVPLDFRGRFGWPRDAILVGYAGQFRPNKGLWDFVRAAEIVLATEGRCRFLIMGRLNPEDSYCGEIAAHLRSCGLAERIVFAGWMDEVERAFSALDALVVPSRHEDPAPNVNIEAMACGVPVVATRAGGSPELVADGETGYLVEKESPAEIAARVLRLAGDDQLRASMGRQGRARVERLFDARRNAVLVEEALLGA